MLDILISLAINACSTNEMPPISRFNKDEWHFISRQAAFSDKTVQDYKTETTDQQYGFIFLFDTKTLIVIHHGESIELPMEIIHQNQAFYTPKPILKGLIKYYKLGLANKLYDCEDCK